MKPSNLVGDNIVLLLVKKRQNQKIPASSVVTLNAQRLLKGIPAIPHLQEFVSVQGLVRQ
jgi:hypothetical protein